MLIGTKLQRFEALLDAIHESGHPQIADALLILSESVEKLESESQVCDARHDHHEMRFSRAGVPRLDAESEDEFTAGMTPIAEPYASQCPTHGLVRIGGVCRMCAPSVPALRLRESHAIGDCVYPCIFHDRDAFTVDSSGRAIGLRKEA
jgi:hypothetical protein